MSGAPPVRLAAGKPATSIVNPVKRKANVLEMLSYVHSLGIDHIREADMVWIAEEAYNASLPPGWTEHEDENGRTYFYNTNRRESLWKHPLDQEFVEIANYWRRAIKAGGFWDIDEELAEMEEKIRASLADWMELYDDMGHKFFFNRKTEESLFDDPRHTTYHSLYTRIRFVNMMKEKLPLLALAPRATDPIINASELLRQQQEAQEKALRSVTRMQAAVRVMLARRRARNLSAKRCLNRIPPDLKGKLRLTIRTAVPGTHEKECVLQVTSSHRRNRAATRIQAHMRGFLTRCRFRPMRDHRRFRIQNAIKIQRAVRYWLSTLADKRAARQARIHACVRIQCWARSVAARKLYAEKLGAKATFVKLKQVIISIQCHVRQWIARRRVKELRRVKYTSSVRMLQRQMKVFKAKAELMQHLRNEEPVQFIFHLTSGQKGSKILPFVWKLGMLPVGEDGCVINPEDFRHQQVLEKMKRRKKNLLKHKTEEEEVDEEPPRPIDLFSKVGVESLSDAAATVIQQTFQATQSGKKCRRAFSCIRSILDFVVDEAAARLSARAAAAPIIQKMFRGWVVRHSGILEQKRVQFFNKKLEKIEIAQSFLHRFSEQVWLKNFIRESSVHEAASKIQALVRGMLARKYVVRLVEEAEWPVKGWFEYTGMGRDCAQISVKFLPNPSFDSWRYFRKYGKQQTLLERIQEMQAEIDSCLRAYLGPAEYAAMEARKAAGQAAQRAKAEAEKEQQEVTAMSIADEESFAIEKVARAEEAEFRRIEEEKLEKRQEEEAREEEARQEEARRAEEALANFSDAAQALIVEVEGEQGDQDEQAPVQEQLAEPSQEAERTDRQEAVASEQPAVPSQEVQEIQEAPRTEGQEAVASEQPAVPSQEVQEIQEAPRTEGQEAVASEQPAVSSQEVQEIQEAPRTEGQEVVLEEQVPQLEEQASREQEQVSQQGLRRKESLDDLLAPSTLDLPPGWEAVWSDEHEAYYFWHLPTNAVQCDCPDPVSPVRPEASLEDNAFVSLDSMVTEVPVRNQSQKDLEGSDSAHDVLTAAAASLEHYARLSQGSGTHRSGGSHISKVSRRPSNEDLRSTAPVAWGQERIQGQGFSQTQFRQAAPLHESMQRTGKPRYAIRAGLVDMDALHKIEGEKMDQRFRRDRISEQRREKYPIPAQVEYNRMNSTVQGVFHRHVHHHVHYYNDQGEEKPPPAELPPKAESEGEASQPLQEFQTQKGSKKKLSKTQVPHKSVHEILRPIGFFPGPVGAAGAGLRKATRSKSEGKLVQPQQAS